MTDTPFMAQRNKLQALREKQNAAPVSKKVSKKKKAKKKTTGD